MANVLGLAGSLRKASFNAGLLRAAAEECPDGLAITIGTIAGVPLYDADDEAANGLPDAVQTLQAQLCAQLQSDGTGANHYCISNWRRWVGGYGQLAREAGRWEGG